MGFNAMQPGKIKKGDIVMLVAAIVDRRRSDRVGGSLTSGRTDDLGALDYCYLTTVGRVSGDAHEIEIWFALNDGILYLLSGGGDRQRLGEEPARDRT